MANIFFVKLHFFRQDSSAANGEAERGLGRKITISLIYLTNIFFLGDCRILYVLKTDFKLKKFEKIVTFEPDLFIKFMR